MVKNASRILYHVCIVIVSAAVALAMPSVAGFIARKFLVYWSLIEHEDIFLVILEITVAALLIFFLQSAGKRWHDRRLSRIARYAGLVSITPVTGFFARRRTKTLKEKEGFARPSEAGQSAFKPSPPKLSKQNGRPFSID